MVLNFDSVDIIFLCLDQPIVIKTIAMIFISGCSSEVRRNALSAICPKEAKPNGDTKYKRIPINNCRWIAIKANNAIFRSLEVNSFLEDIPIKELISATTNTKRARYAQPE